MDTHHFRLTLDDLNELIVKYKIPHDLHPRLPSKGFVMSEFPDDAIGVYHCVFDFSSARIPFYTFLLSIIKYNYVHFSQLGPLGLNKVITFEVLCQSLQIELTAHFFKRHPSLAIDDPKPLAGSYNMEDVRRLSALVVKLRDIPKGVLVLFGLSGVWKSQTYDPLWALKISCVFLSRPRLRFRKNLIMIFGPLCRGFPSTVPPAATDAAILEPTLKDLATGTPSLPWLNHLEVLPKPSLFSADSEEESDDDEDALVEIPLITPIRSAAVIPTNGNHSGGSAPSVAKDSRGKAVMNDATATPPGQLAVPGLSLVLLLLSEISLTMLFIGTSSPFLLAPIMPRIQKVELMVTLSSAMRNGMLHISPPLPF
ncbi:hypothetical protein Tco_1035576 [Tanacetum coccineum]